MSGKARHKRGKRSAKGKRKIDRSSHPTMLPQQPAVVQINEPVSSAKMPHPSASVPSPAAKPPAVQYPYLSTELRTIGILAVIMLVILIVLALVPLPW